MRYIKYVVAALIFLAVVNAAARFFGNDTQELLSDLNPDQQVTEAAESTTSQPPTTPEVNAEEGQAQATTGTEPLAATAETQGDEIVEVDPAATEQPAADTILAPAATTTATTATTPTTPDPLKEAVANTATQGNKVVETALTEIQAPSKTELDSIVADDNSTEAIVNAVTEAAGEEAGEEAAVENAVESVVADATPKVQQVAAALEMPTTSAADTAKTAISEPITPPAPAAVAQTPIAEEPAVIETPAVAAVTTETVADAATPGLIQSLGDSAGSAATAVVGGAQQAVETVVEAARSLIDPKDKATEVTASATDAASVASVENPPTQIDPAVTVVAAAVTDATQAEQATTTTTTTTKQLAAVDAKVQASTVTEPATTERTTTPAQPAAEPTQTTSKPTAPTEVAAVTPIAAPTVTPKVQTQTATKVVTKSASRSRDFSIAPPLVLALVNRHPGKIVMVGFFSPNCGDCKPSLAWLNEMRRKYWAQGLQVIGVNLGTQAQAKTYLQDAPVSFEILHDPDRELAAAFWLSEQPSTYLVDPSGKLLSSHQGHSAARLGQYEDAIRTALEQR